MSYALAQATTTRRSGLLGVVVGAHVGVLLLIVASKTVVPQIMEIPMVVELLQPAAPKSEPKPLPVAKPVVTRPQPAPKAPTPVIETTASSQPSPSAAVAAVAENKPAPSPAPVAEAVSQARFDADYLRNPAPNYPPLSRRMGEQGKVILRVQVSPQGAAESVDVKTTSGSQRLDDAAVNTVKNWKFVPARRGDTPVQSWVLVPIIFKLEQ